ncbi:MAG TPA: hypothetical protein VLG38_03325 [Gammaproteobacteria bacterium]|nr:hypothetical protein [Gammaproteobacteria bacterium]
MSDKDEPGDKNKKDPLLEAAKQIINRYRDAYKHISPDVLFNLSNIKENTEEITPDSLDAAAEVISTHLGNAESGETLREERWHGKVACPFCASLHIKRLAVEEQKSSEIYKYQCLDCNATFDDDTETKIESGIPPLHTWMFCWYLLGCTSSVQYIASKLGLSVHVVEMMIQHMRRLFKADEPMKHFMSFDEWSLKIGKSYKVAMQEALAKQKERFSGFSLGQEVDTAEVRRQKHRTKPTPR